MFLFWNSILSKSSFSVELEFHELEFRENFQVELKFHELEFMELEFQKKKKKKS